MTAPGSIIAPQPGWWVRTNRIGTDDSQFGWAAAATGSSAYQGTGSGGYGWSSAAAGISPILYDTTGAGASNIASSLSWSHTAALGSTILAAVASHDTSTATLTYNGTPMTLLCTGTTGTTGSLMGFGLIGAGTGSAATVAATFSTSTDVRGNSVSYKSVSSFGTVATSSSGGSSSSALSLGPITSAPGQMIFQAFGAGEFTAGESISAYNQTSRYNSGGPASVVLLIGDAPGAASVTFTATGSDSSAFWTAFAIPLIP